LERKILVCTKLEAEGYDLFVALQRHYAKMEREVKELYALFPFDH
jgi:hypothetical protein